MENIFGSIYPIEASAIFSGEAPIGAAAASGVLFPAPLARTFMQQLSLRNDDDFVVESNALMSSNTWPSGPTQLLLHASHARHRMPHSFG